MKEDICIKIYQNLIYTHAYIRARICVNMAYSINFIKRIHKYMHAYKHNLFYVQWMFAEYLSSKI
jgi:hypothetical protein